MSDEPFAKTLLQDRVVLVTGGGSGLGRAMAERFLALGAKLVIAGRREAVLQEAARELGGDVLPVPCDVRDAAQVAAMMDAAEAHFGRVDVLINNAAGNFISPTERLSPRAVDAVLNIVLHGTFYCTLELANLAAFLISDAAAFITGDLISIDGGETAWNGGEFNILDEVTPEQWDALSAKRKKG